MTGWAWEKANLLSSFQPARHQSQSVAQPQLLCNAKAFRNGIDMEITRIFQPGTADQQELLAVLELLLNEPPPATAPTQTACADSHESSPAK